MKIPESAIISQEEADRRQRESKHHTVISQEGVTAHYCHDPKTGVTTLLRMETDKQRDSFSR